MNTFDGFEWYQPHRGHRQSNHFGIKGNTRLEYGDRKESNAFWRHIMLRESGISQPWYERLRQRRGKY
ncbi:hypothetical protein [Paenibacillus caui]|uniref:hypothetical protein n=1 Tax=Paenibacillus caui TaxID=2873927 RepID=UPI001CAA1E7D|nr:hypothetical protein [Paenibacillus caui]